MKFCDWYVNRVKVGDGEKNSGEIITTTLGYISPKRQIESILSAGERLRIARENEYTYPSSSVVEDDGYTCPNIYADKVDIAELSMNLQERMIEGLEQNSSSEESVKNTSEGSKENEEKINTPESI